MESKQAIIAVTIGDVEGIGPEIVKKGLEKVIVRSPIVVIGDDSFENASEYPKIASIDQVTANNIYFLSVDTKVNPHHGSFQFVEYATVLALQKKIDAIVTAPISKERWVRSGVPFKGHTGYLARKAGVSDYAMGFWSDNIKTVLYTIHIPMKEMFASLKTEKIVTFIRFVNNELKRMFGKSFRFLIPGLNPHAGEEGLMGNEERDIIIPAIDELKSELDIAGPYPPDTIFLQALKSDRNIVISWYHDQGLIPFKLLNIHKGVNLTLGLPFVRTSPDHGTAEEIAGKNMANPSSMIEAIKLAQDIIL